MIKDKVFFDFDGVIVNSTKAYCEVYNSIYMGNKDFEFADYTKNDRWDLKDTCPLITNYEDIFNSSDFFEACDLMDSETYNVLKKLSEDYELIICSTGLSLNLALKSVWINTHLPFIKNVILLNRHKGQLINMEQSLLIDDLDYNLVKSNAKYKICFGRELGWNKNTKCKRILSFKELDTCIRTILKF